jgi:DNA-binding transcriptional LysR family regulator
MRPINLAAFDLNLLIAFEALYEERHVSRAGAKIGLSQPSMSHALKRLRETFGDELFTRGPGGMTPTANAVELARHILPGIGQLRAVMSGGTEFDALASERRFIIGLTDLGSFSVLPRLTPALRSSAPGVSLTVVPVGSRDAIDKILTGEIELACSVFQDLPSDIDSHKITELASVCVTDRRNPRLAGRSLDLDTFLDLPHVQIAVNADPGAAVDAELAALSLRRRIAVVVPHFLAVPGAVLGTDLIGVIDSEAMLAFQGWEDLRFDPLPVNVPNLGVSMVWHRRSRRDPGHRWLRELIAERVAGPPAEPLALGPLPDPAGTGRPG